MSDDQSDFRPYTETLRLECPRLRVLVVGKSGVGKSALINAVFGVNLSNVSHKEVGVHNIEKEHFHPSNDRVVIHDSQGFEAGEENNMEKVLGFIDKRRKMSALADRLHTIWVCVQVPHAGGRLFERGVELILEQYSETVPIIVVFTKLDLLRFHMNEVLEAQLDDQSDQLEDDEFEKRLDADVDNMVQVLCVQPLRNLRSREYPWVVTSTRAEHKRTIQDLVNKALDETKLETVWLNMAISQRSSAKMKIDASVKIGRKKYWSFLRSNTFFGKRMNKVIQVLHQDIIAVWNMEDSRQLLARPEFQGLISVLVEDLSEEQGDDYRRTRNHIQSVIDHSALGPIGGPIVFGLNLFATWVHGTYEETKNSIRCIMAYIIDLSLTLDILFYFVLAHGRENMTIRLINGAILVYQRKKKKTVHNSLQAWVKLWSPFTHMNANVVISKMEEIIMDNRVKPEAWGMEKTETQEAWLTMKELREVTSENK